MLGLGGTRTIGLPDTCKEKCFSRICLCGGSLSIISAIETIAIVSFVLAILECFIGGWILVTGLMAIPSGKTFQIPTTPAPSNVAGFENKIYTNRSATPLYQLQIVGGSISVLFSFFRFLMVLHWKRKISTERKTSFLITGGCGYLTCFASMGFFGVLLVTRTTNIGFLVLSIFDILFIAVFAGPIVFLIGYYVRRRTEGDVERRLDDWADAHGPGPWWSNAQSNQM